MLKGEMDSSKINLEFSKGRIGLPLLSFTYKLFDYLEPDLLSGSISKLRSGDYTAFLFLSISTVVPL